MRTETTFERSLDRVLAYRERARKRATWARIGLAVIGAAALLVSVPLVVVLPEVGVPVALVALRLLAVEADWAARAYAWTDWRFSQARAWFHRQPWPMRLAVGVLLLVLAVALVWFLVHELS